MNTEEKSAAETKELSSSGEASGEIPGEASSEIPDENSGASRLTFFDGIKSGVPIFIGYLPIAIAFGLLARNTGVPLAHTVGMSLLVFAGASQFMALELIALGTGAFEIVFSTFIVNIRHLLMSMSIHERAVSEGKARKASYAFFITDEVFAVASTREESIGSSFLYGIGIMAYLGWTVNSAAGYLVGTVLPVTLQAGMGVALYAMFIGLLVPSIKKHRKALFLAAMAALCNSVLVLYLPTGWAIIGASVAAVVLLELIESLISERESEEEAEEYVP
jgi:4-azaleucine resistance transporter AzlC